MPINFVWWKDSESAVLGGRMMRAWHAVTDADHKLCIPDYDQRSPRGKYQTGLIARALGPSSYFPETFLRIAIELPAYPVRYHEVCSGRY